MVKEDKTYTADDIEKAQCNMYILSFIKELFFLDVT